MTRRPTNGIDDLISESAWRTRLAGRRVGVLTNDACRLADGRPTAIALHDRLGTALDCIFVAEHGAATTIAAGAPVGHGRHPATGLPVYSLYGAAKHRAIDHARTLDTVIIDLRDLGVRCYTYATTAAELVTGLCGAGTEVIVCDRPNPLGPAQLGPRPQLRSFLAYLDVPFVHGHTLGRLLGDFHDHLGPDKPPLTVVATSGGGSPASWVPPSPALDHPDTVPLYPGLVLLEGTNLNEGRGTTRPFRSITAPWLSADDADALAATARRWPASGVTARPWRTRPRSGADTGRLCHGLALRVAGARRTDAFAFTVRVLCILARNKNFRWTPGRVTHRTLPWQPDDPRPLETRPFIDSLFGDAGLRRAIATGKTADAVIRACRTAPPAPRPAP